jgi:hypothetical protein
MARRAVKINDPALAVVVHQNCPNFTLRSVLWIAEARAPAKCRIKRLARRLGC